MNRTTATRAILPAALVLGSFAIAAGPGADAAPPSHKTFDAVASDSVGQPLTLAAGTSTAASITISNTTRQPQTFASADITPPAGFTICADDPCAPTVDATGYRAFWDGTVLGIRNDSGAGIGPGGSLAVSFTVTVPASGSCGATTWPVRVKQSNDFLGTGNDFTGNDLDIPVTGGGQLEWSEQPSATQWDEPMDPAPELTVTSACGGSVADLVDELVVSDEAGQLASTGAAATASGDGIVLDDVTFKTFGFTDTLTATLDGFPPVTSGEFPVAQSLTACPVDTECTTPTIGDNGKMTQSSIHAGSGPADKLLMSLNAPPEDSTCAGDLGPANDGPYGSVLTFLSGRGKTVTMTLAKKLVNAISNNGTPFMDICLEVPDEHAFFDKAAWADGSTDGDTMVTEGFLPDCDVTADVPPCVVSRGKNRGNEVIVFTAVSGDPRSSVY